MPAPAMWACSRSHLGIEFTEWGDDFLRGTMPVEPRTRQPMGYLHGGASLVLAETLGSVAANFVVDYSQVPLPRPGDQRQSSASRHGRPGDRHGARRFTWARAARCGASKSAIRGNAWCASRVSPMAVVEWRP